VKNWTPIEIRYRI